MGFTLLWAAMFTNIYHHQLTRVQASTWFWEQVPGDFAMRLDDAGPDVPLINIAIGNGYNEGTDVVEMSSLTADGATVITSFVAPADGTITSVYAPHLGDPQDDPEPETIQVSMSNSGGR